MEKLNDLINKFVESIIIHHDESNGGENYHLANKYYKISVDCFCKIKEYDEWVSAFKDLLQHDNSIVRVNAACYLLPYETKLAVKTLKWSAFFAAKSVGFTAKTVLHEWKTGNLKFPELEDGKVVYK